MAGRRLKGGLRFAWRLSRRRGSTCRAAEWDDPLYGGARLRSPAVVGERLVRFRHAVGFFALLDGAAAAFRGVDQFGSQLARHGVLAALARRLDQPAHGQRHTARGADFDRHLVGGTADATRLHFDRRRNVAQCLLDELEGIGVLLADDIHRAVDDLLGDRLLAALHDHVDETGDRLAAVLGVRQDRTLRGGTFTRHGAYLFS